MAMPAFSAVWTAEMARALPVDGNRYEVVHGELLVSPAPRPFHQEVVWRLMSALRPYLAREPVGHAFAAPLEARHSQTTELQPDIVVFRSGAVTPTSWSSLGHALLVIEVLSPSTARTDRFVKRPVVQQAGVPLLWLVNIDDGAVEWWTPEAHLPRVERERLAWHPAGASAPFLIELDELLRPM